MKVLFLPSGRTGSCRPGETVLKTALRLGIDVGQQCGERGVCGKCRVRITEGKVDSPSEQEKKQLSREDLDRNIRLGCMTHPVSDIRVEVLAAPGEILTTKTVLSNDGFQIQHQYSSYNVTCPPPSLSDWRDDLTRLEEAVAEASGIDVLGIDPALLKEFSKQVREWEWAFTAFLRGNEIIGIAPSETRLLGLAVDIGSTKIAGYLLDMEKGEVLASGGRNNPQRTYGADIITRLTYAVESSEKRELLTALVTDEIDNLGKELCDQVNFSHKVLLSVVLVGNTAMHHLFFGLPVKYLTSAPYVPVNTTALTVKGRDVGFSFAPGSYCSFLPNIAGFIGSDHVAMILSMGRRLEEDKTILMLDVGTNTEICLFHEGTMKSVSAPSGSAFEGGHIEWGMTAGDGAIEGVCIGEDGISLEVIGNTDPVGICGSGIIDAIAELYRKAIIDWRGRFQDDPRVSPEKRFPLGEKVYISQKDIQEFMLAKGAIGAGVAVLLEHQNIAEEDLDQVIIAGAFGAHINVKSAIAIGLFPNIPEDRFMHAGNAAGAGAVQALLSAEQFRTALEIQKKVEYLELATEKGFRDAYTRSSFFPREKAEQGSL